MPGERPGHRPVERRGEIPLVRARVAATTRRVDHERLERLPPSVVARAGDAPRREHLVLVAGPGAGRGDAGVGRRMPFGLSRGLPLIALVLLAVAVGVTAAQGEAAAERLGAVRAGHVETAEAARVVTEAPELLRRVGVPASRGPYAAMKADRDVVGDEVHHATQRRGAIERGAGPLHDLDAVDLLERHHVPVDATAVAFVRRHAIHQQQHPRAEAFHEAARAADVHLAVEEQNPRGPVHGFVHGAHGAARDVRVRY